MFGALVRLPLPIALLLMIIHVAGVYAMEIVGWIAFAIGTLAVAGAAYAIVLQSGGRFTAIDSLLRLSATNSGADKSRPQAKTAATPRSTERDTPMTPLSPPAPPTPPKSNIPRPPIAPVTITTPT